MNINLLNYNWIYKIHYNTLEISKILYKLLCNINSIKVSIELNIKSNIYYYHVIKRRNI